MHAIAVEKLHIMRIYWLCLSYIVNECHEAAAARLENLVTLYSTVRWFVNPSLRISSEMVKS